jgi:hypothetical protein
MAGARRIEPTTMQMVMSVTMVSLKSTTKATMKSAIEAAKSKYPTRLARLVHNAIFALRNRTGSEDECGLSGALMTLSA